MSFDDLVGVWDRCREFVKAVTAGRDFSHGWYHMEQVTSTAVNIGLLSNRGSSIMQKIVLVGMLHDVNDHKYDPDGVVDEQLRRFISTIYPEQVDLVMTTIGAISYSKEVKKGHRWFTSLLPPEWVIVRDTVSDADKLHGMGKEGIDRCIEFSRHLLRKSTGEEPTDEQVISNVKKHADEKLLRLKEHFIVTETGKFLAKPLHDQMVEMLEAFD